MYDLQRDPYELRHVFEKREYASVRHQLEQRLLNWQTQTGDAVPFEPDPRGFLTGLVH